MASGTAKAENLKILLQTNAAQPPQVSSVTSYLRVLLAVPGHTIAPSLLCCGTLELQDTPAVGLRENTWCMNSCQCGAMATEQVQRWSPPSPAWRWNTWPLENDRKTVGGQGPFQYKFCEIQQQIRQIRSLSLVWRSKKHFTPQTLRVKLINVSRRVCLLDNLWHFLMSQQSVW